MFFTVSFAGNNIQKPIQEVVENPHPCVNDALAMAWFVDDITGCGFNRGYMVAFKFCMDAY